MKKTLILMLIVLGILSVLTSPVYAASPTHTPKPTPTLNPTQMARRLDRAKTLARKMVTKREEDLNKLSDRLKKYKGTTLANDYAELEKLITTMRTMLATWKTEVAAATTVDEVKSVANKNVLKTRYFLVFKPAFNLLTRVMVMNKAEAQIETRIKSYETELAGKYNNTANNAYENATKRLSEAKEGSQGVTAALQSEKSAIYALSPELANSDRDAYNKKVNEVRTQVNTTNAKIKNLFAKLKNVKTTLDRIKNATPTPASN